MKTPILSLAISYISFFSPQAAEALVLCAPKGVGVNTIVEGGQIVARTSCNTNEITLSPVTIRDNGDIIEDFPKNRIQSVGSDSSLAIGGDNSTTVGKSAATTIGDSEAVTIGADQLSRSEAISRYP